MKPVKISPYVTSALWGGSRLISEYSIESDSENVAEAWVLSCHQRGSSTVVTGEYSGKTLREVFESDRSTFGKKCEMLDDFPLLIKFIDAKENLSVQVHPDEEYARKNENASGKTECWYILDCEKEAELILGFKEKIDKDTFQKAIEDNTLSKFVKRYKVKKGDFFFLQAGTLHSICKGVLLAEVQQNSDITYRVYDYGRKDKNGNARELHTKKAIDVTKTEPYIFYEPSEKEAFEDENRKLLVNCELFTVCKLCFDREYKGVSDENSFVSLLVLSGEGDFVCGDTAFAIKKGESIFVPANKGEFTLSGKMEILETRI